MEPIREAYPDCIDEKEGGGVLGVVYKLREILAILLVKLSWKIDEVALFLDGDAAAAQAVYLLYDFLLERRCDGDSNNRHLPWRES